MAELKIFWTHTAVKQRNYIFSYWNSRNKSTSYTKKLNQSIKERTSLLKSNPKIGKKTEFKETRIVSLGHYSILYKKIDLKIIITGFWDNRQQPKKLIAFLKKN
ncbi:MAG: type II toxin-antitoxin system RelE/ParE family toxin [Flavobacteriales bacterium]|nr:type II toxin-antitoxin system RelE/ParE family toxin [Flavobacteriales bacterium]